MPDDLYHSDILAWSRTQADRLRRLKAGERPNDLDWDHVIEEVEDVGKAELKSVRSHLQNAMVHALKVAAWPEHSARRKWRNEITAFLGQARNRFEPGMVQHLDLAELYSDALAVVHDLDMRSPPAPLPQRIALSPAAIMARGFGADDLIAAIRAAQAGGADA